MTHFGVGCLSVTGLPRNTCSTAHICVIWRLAFLHGTVSKPYTRSTIIPLSPRRCTDDESYRPVQCSVVEVRSVAAIARRKIAGQSRTVPLVGAFIAALGIEDLDTIYGFAFAALSQRPNTMVENAVRACVRCHKRKIKVACWLFIQVVTGIDHLL